MEVSWFPYGTGVSRGQFACLDVDKSASPSYLISRYVVIIPVAVKKLGFPGKSQNSGDRKCLGDSEKSFIELPDAIQFLQILSERVFQHPPLFSTSIGPSVSR